MRNFFLYTVFLLLFSGCRQKKNDDAILFTALESDKTGLDFTNTLTSSPEFNMFKYMYFYNGAGVGAGDFNKDGLIDLFFSSNQGQNKLYINKGNLQFNDVTAVSRIPADSAWSTGVSVVDINNDGLLDIYVCRVSQYEMLRGRNLLLVCDSISSSGIPVFSERAKEYGIDFSGFSTQAAFLDYDLDGDLDMYLMNHTVHHNGTFGPRSNFMNTYHPLSGDRLFRNESASGTKGFTDVTKESGINSTVIGYGLGIAVADINLDGYPDIYIGNDFHENDYLYINQQNGTFRDELNERIMHTSQFSMGVDIADVNNDAWPEIISLDMLPSDPYILRRSLGEDAYDIFKYKVSIGYNHQYARNNLQYNRGNGLFSETGLYSGVYATDWSWAALWMDFDNNGLKDLFVSNGIPKRLNDIDYVNYVSADEIQKKIRENRLEEKEMTIIDNFPEIKLPNCFFKNEGDLRFSDAGKNIANNKKTFSNGSVYADFDNDGDLDIVTSNINEPALLYKNTTNDNSVKRFLSVRLTGPENNINATGAKAIVYAGKNRYVYEKNPVRGFQSSMEIPLHIGLDNIAVDSLLIIWPDNTYQHLQLPATESNIQISYRTGLPVFNYTKFTVAPSQRLFADVTKQLNLEYVHKENSFNEFNREPLLPRALSTEGPALAVGDCNGDGLDDVFFGSSKWEKSALFIQQPGGRFYRSFQPALDMDSTYEDTDACWADVNNDGYNDLIVASGGNEYYGSSKYQLPRIYLSGKGGLLQRKEDAFDKNLFIQASCVAAYDFTGDGYTDLFIGGRTVPFEYGKVPQSYLLANDKTGKFTDVTDSYNKEMGKAGFVKHAAWTDVDKDNDKDLVLSLEWDGILVFINNKKSFSKKYITTKKGWWNFTLPCDVDNDGDIDFIAGNLGLNSRLKASAAEPVRMYYNDFDGNDTREQVLTYYLNGKELPFANKAELEKRIPLLKKNFLYAENFARAGLSDLFTADKIKSSAIFTADYFSNAVLLNDGNMNFTEIPLPWQAQISSYNDAVTLDINADALPDVLLAGNFYENNIQMGRYDADYGTILINRGKGNFAYQPVSGLMLKGEARHVKKVKAGSKEFFIIARNNAASVVLDLK